MLKSWSIKNFKPIIDSGELQLAPVTIFAGRNSSGKSSLLQSILMIAQTLGSRLLDRPLLPNERLVQLGTFDDILSEFASTKTLSLSFELEFENDEPAYYDLERSVTVSTLEVRERPGPYRIEAYEEEPDPLWPEFSTNKEVAKLSLDFQNIDQANLREISSLMEASKIQISSASFDLTPFDVEARQYMARLDHFHLDFRQTTKQDFDAISQEFAKLKSKRGLDEIKLLDYIGKLGGNTYLLSLAHFLPHTMYRLPKKTKDRKSPFNNFFDEDEYRLDIAAAFSDSVARIERFFISKLRYLGPLRIDPGIVRNQFAPTSEIDDVGSKGEYAAMVFHTSKSAAIQWYNPQTKQVESSSLQVALDTWAQYLGVAEHIDTEIAGALGVTWRITIKKGTKTRLLHEVGVGVSQILPILISGLFSHPGSLLIIEQPELHLHPYVQARLGDFFMGLAKCKKQCVIETHSENLVNQLRLHIVEAGGLEKSDCMIYFVDQDERGAAKFDKIKISPNGNIMNWPEGFFDETMLQEDRITAASLRKRAQQTKHGS